MTFRSLAAIRYQKPDTGSFRIAVEKRNVVLKPAKPLLDQLGWQEKMKLDVQLGDGPDAGTILITPDPKGWMLMRAGGDAVSLVLKVGRHLFPDLPNRHASSPTRAEVRDKAIIAWLPWAAPRQNANADPDAALGDDGRVETGEAAAESTMAAASPPIPAQASSTRSIAAPAPTKAAPPQPITNNPATWVPEVRGLFVAAAKRGARVAELVEISGRNTGSIRDIIARYFKSDLPHWPNPEPDGQTAPKKRVVPPFKAGPLPPAPQPAERAADIASAKSSLAIQHDMRAAGVKPMAPGAYARQQADEPSDPKPTLLPELLRFLRDECVPVLLPLDIRITKNADDTGLLRNGKPVTLGEVVAEVNRILAQAGDDPVKFEAAA